MSARTLQEAYQACGEDLSQKEAFLRYYITRESGASLELTQKMLMDRRPVKALLAGQRGSGKTVELMRVVHDTKPTMTPVRVRLEGASESSTEPEILLIAAREMCAGLIEHGVQLSDGVCRSFTRWLREALKAPFEEKSSLQGVLEAVGRAAERARKKELRAELTSALESGRDELAVRLTELGADVKARTGKELLLIIDDLERLGKEPVANFLLGSGLLRLGFKAICTMPFSLLHSAHYRSIRQSFDMVGVQPVAEITPGSLALRDGGITELRDIVEKRMGDELFEPPSLDMLLLNSGGSPGDLLRLTAASCLKASTQGRRRISPGVVERVLEEHRQEMRRLLSAEEWERLAQVERDKNVAVDAALESLLELGVVLERFDRKESFRVHPVLAPLLKEKGGA